MKDTFEKVPENPEEAKKAIDQAVADVEDAYTGYEQTMDTLGALKDARLRSGSTEGIAEFMKEATEMENKAKEEIANSADAMKKLMEKSGHLLDEETKEEYRNRIAQAKGEGAN